MARFQTAQYRPPRLLVITVRIWHRNAIDHKRGVSDGGRDELRFGIQNEFGIEIAVVEGRPCCLWDGTSTKGVAVEPAFQRLEVVEEVLKWKRLQKTIISQVVLKMWYLMRMIMLQAKPEIPQYQHFQSAHAFANVPVMVIDVQRWFVSVQDPKTTQKLVLRVRIHELVPE